MSPLFKVHRLHVLVEAALLFTCIVTVFTMKRLLARMCSYMPGETALPCKAFPTMTAFMSPLFKVHRLHVRAEVALLFTCIVTIITLVRRFPCMCPNVAGECRFVRKVFGAAGKRAA